MEYYTLLCKCRDTDSISFNGIIYKLWYDLTIYDILLLNNLMQENLPSPEQPKPTETTGSNRFLNVWKGRLMDFGPYAAYAAVGAYAISQDNYLAATLAGVVGAATLVKELLHRRKMKTKFGDDYYNRE